MDNLWKAGKGGPRVFFPALSLVGLGRPSSGAALARVNRGKDFSMKAQKKRIWALRKGGAVGAASKGCIRC